MFRKLTFAVGFGAGYAVGVQAGKERYAQLEAVVRESSRLPAVRQVRGNISSVASMVVSSARSALDRAAEKVRARPGQKAADSAGILATSEEAISLDSVSIDELSERELDLLTTPERSQ